MPATASNSMSKSELRSAIHQQLRNDGVLNEITTTIRSRLVQSLLKENNGSTDAAPLTNDFTRNHQEMALLSLLYHYLDQNSMMHTLSVFASESKMEHSLQYPLSRVGAIKALGLEVIWNEFHRKEGNEGVQIELLPLLQSVAHWVSTQQERDAAAKLQSSQHSNPLQATKSIQTDKAMVPRRTITNPENDRENVSVNHSNIDKGLGANKAIEQRLIDIERECQQRMRQEMNEKLRLSAKKQAAIATRRLEQKHKETLQSLRNQIEIERAQARHRMGELNDHLSQQKLMAQKESSEKEQTLRTISLDKQSLQSEMDLLNERVKEMQQRRFEEWTDEHETFARAHNQSMAELEEQKRHLQIQINDISLQKDTMKAKELRLASLEQDQDRLLAEIQDLRHQQASSLALQQSSFEQAQSDLQSKYDTAKDEVKGLRTLLKQTQGVLQTVSFRELGKASANSMNMKPSIYSRNVMRKTTHLEQRAPPSMEAIARPYRRPDLVVATSTNSAARIEVQQHVSSNPMSSDNNLQKEENKENNILDEKKSHYVETAIPEDPPCSSAEDPPEMSESNYHQANLSSRKDIARSGESTSTQGTGFILNISAITEGVQSNKEFVEASGTSHVEDNASVKSSHSQTKTNRAENYVATEQDTAQIKGHSAQSIVVEPLGDSQSEELYQSDTNSEAGDAKSQVVNAQMTNPSTASEAQYSESFHTFNEAINQSTAAPPQGSIHTSSHEKYYFHDQINMHSEEKTYSLGFPSSASSADSSDGYSESFCS